MPDLKCNDSYLRRFAFDADFPVVHEGWLEKDGGRGHTEWQKRWCVLKENMLFYYKERPKKETVRLVPLLTCCACVSTFSLTRCVLFLAILCAAHPINNRTSSKAFSS